MFHHHVAKLIYLSKQSRPDIQTAVSYLYTRIHNSDIDDMKKLIWKIKYLQLTQWLTLTLESDDVLILKWWVGASYDMHNYFRIQNGSTVSLGKGFPYSKSSKQKPNRKISTEDEIVGIDYINPKILWTRYFMEAQGYHKMDNIVNQDNQSIILLSRNRMDSSSKSTKHINIGYLFVTDRIANEETSVEYFPIDDMLGGLFAKPTQGSLFRNFRKLILNLWTDDLYRYDPKRSQECVESTDLLHK